MYLIGNIVLGQDARTFPSSDGTRTYAQISGWWKHGKGEDSHFQWGDFKLLDSNAAKVAPMLTKGKTIHIIATQVHTELYQPKDAAKEAKTKLVGLIVRLDFVGKRDESVPQPAHDHKKAASEPARRPSASFDDDDDVPF